MLTSKERINRIIRHQPVDRIGLFEVFWGETVRSWVAQGANIVRKELGLATTYVAAADPALQIDIVPKS